MVGWIPINRLETADFVNNGLYSTSYSYDKNGNIETLNRYKDINGVAVEIDRLDYAYNGNQLVSVDDEMGSHFESYGFRDRGAQESIEYLYDANGNMVKDLNKGIHFVDYNHMNLPVYIGVDQNQGKKIYYTYTPDGVKLRKRAINNGVDQNKTDYIGASPSSLIIF